MFNSAFTTMYNVHLAFGHVFIYHAISLRCELNSVESVFFNGFGTSNCLQNNCKSTKIYDLPLLTKHYDFFLLVCAYFSAQTTSVKLNIMLSVFSLCKLATNWHCQMKRRYLIKKKLPHNAEISVSNPNVSVSFEKNVHYIHSIAKE